MNIHFIGKFITKYSFLYIPNFQFILKNETFEKNLKINENDQNITVR